MTNPGRTIVDWFNYRNKVGIDVVIEALRNCWRQKKATMDDLHSIAKARRMANVMQPYARKLRVQGANVFQAPIRPAPPRL